jgi:colanic acid/amylovoran biosynthesis glycosyltransferase
MRVFQVLPSVIRRIGGELQIDVDFYEALEVYLEHFEVVTVACPISTSSEYGTGLERCRGIEKLDRSRLRIIGLPHAYSLYKFLHNLASIKALLRAEILDADYLIFSPHTLIGDWPSVAIHEAIKLKKEYVLEADVVYESVARNGFAHNAAWKRLLKEMLLVPQFSKSYRRCLASSKLALFQGKDVFDAYAIFCDNPHKVEHHIPIHRNDHITEEKLITKLERIRSGAPLRICYAGRVVSMKGPIDWVNTIHELLKANVRLNATWLGDGSLLPFIRTRLASLGIADHVQFPGYVLDRAAILDALQSSDIFLYCHQTQESARVLGEALACACPIVGYGSAYPVDLVSEFGGGLFASLGDWGQLAEHIQHLDRNREELVELVQRAARSGSRFDRTKLLHERMLLVKRYIHPALT